VAGDESSPARYRLVLRHADGRLERGAIRRLRPDSPRPGHAFSTRQDGGPVSWQVVEDRVEHDEGGITYIALYAERDYAEQDGSLPDHQLEHALARPREELPDLAATTLARAAEAGLSAELVALEPEEVPDWAEAQRYLDALTLDTVGDDLIERCGVDTRRDPEDGWLGTVKERLAADLEAFRADVEGDHDEIEEWEYSDGRIFVSIGSNEDEGRPESSHGWLVRLFDSGILGAAGFSRVRRAELLP
jgi:hypothetical protein